MTPTVHVLLLHHVAAISGAERGLLDVARALRDSGHEVEIGLPRWGPLVEQVNAEGFMTHPLPVTRIYRTRNPVKLARIAFRLVKATFLIRKIIHHSHIEVVHCNSDTAMLFGAAAASLTGRFCVWHRRDLVALGRLGQLLGQVASRIICISECVAHTPDSYATARLRPVMIYNGIDSSVVSPTKPRAEARQMLGIDPEDVAIVNIGQLIPWKRQDLFIAAAHAVADELANAQFLLVGSDMFGNHGDYVQSLREAAERGPAAGRIRFIGYREDMGDVLQATDLVVHAAEREPFGRAIAEAMSVGRAVIAPNACGPAELIVDGESGILVPPGDVDAMAQAMVDLASNAAERRRLGAAAGERIESQFSIGAFAEKLAELYSEITGVGGLV